MSRAIGGERDQLLGHLCHFFSFYNVGYFFLVWKRPGMEAKPIFELDQSLIKTRVGRNMSLFILFNKVVTVS